MADTIFTRIINRELPAEILYEDGTTIAILNRFPNTEGETLVIPKEPISYVFDLDDATYAHLMQITRKLARALDRAFGTLRTCVVIEGFDVPHVHVRLYPIVSGTLDISQGPEAGDEELAEVGKRIRAHLD